LKENSTTNPTSNDKPPSFETEEERQKFEKDAKDALIGAKEEVTALQQRIAAVMLTDFYEDNPHSSQSTMIKRLRGACKRAGMLDGGDKERYFFNVISDQRFMTAVQQLGKGLIGINVVPLVNKLIEMGLKGNEKCLFKALEIASVAPTKYSVYMNQVNNRNAPESVNSVTVNFGDKSDRELEKLANDLNDVEEAEEIFS